MRTNRRNTKRKKQLTLAAFALVGAAWLIFSGALPFAAQGDGGGDRAKLEITANFAGAEIAPDARLEFVTSRALAADEGRFGVVIGDTDVSALCAFENVNLSYVPRVEPLPAGETTIKIYLVAPGGDWRSVAEFPLKVSSKQQSAANGEQPQADNGQTAASDDGKMKIKFTPNITLNLKGQNQNLTFPRESAPERNPFTDLAGTGNIAFSIERTGWKLSSQFDFAGSSFSRERLRFGELGQRAPDVDLSSYLVTVERGRFNAKFGHVSFGSNKHLINGFSSRGVSVTVPVGQGNDVSLFAANGTSIVGYDNFVGITRRRHSVLGATFAREFFQETPGKLRVEATVMRGSLLPLSNFNQREVNDAEKSTGYGFRVLGNNFKQRLRYEAGFTRSRFRNPPDPLLEQGFEVTEIRPASRNARYGEISFDFFQGLKLWREKKLKFTGTYRHEEIQPLFRSLAASTQADRHQNQFEISATFGEINFAYGNLRDFDNLNFLPSILRTLNRRNNAVFGIALNSFFTPAKPIKWLPVVSYTYDHVHQFGAFLPVNGEFRDLSQIPDQDSFAQTATAAWQINDKLNFSLRSNRAFQDNKQPGRELADFESGATGLTVGYNPLKSLNLNFDVSREGQRNFEQPRVDRTFRVGWGATWQMPFLKNLTWNANFSTTLAGDADNLNDTRNADFDTQLAHKFALGGRKFKKMETQIFVRYANRYGDAVDRVFFVNNFNKTQSFNFGLTFSLF